MVRLFLIIVDIAPIAGIIIFNLFFPEEYRADSFFRYSWIYGGIIGDNSVVFAQFSIALAIFLKFQWKTLTEWDRAFEYKIELLLSRPGVSRGDEKVRDYIHQAYHKILNGQFPSGAGVDALTIKGQFIKFKADSTLAIVKCRCPSEKSWYSLHSLHDDSLFILSRDFRELKRIALGKST
ncbi:MAG: hypothetical protein PQJ60_06590 [Spirochaetales bacterium]|nr:hypothetical protein [Spirochaetales bacterium]